MSALLNKAVSLAKAAGNRYVFGAEGPNAYDCSGLVWAAAKAIGVYKGERFTTYTITHHAADAAQFVRVATPAVGDIVVWDENAAHGHMGIVSGPDQFFSARSVASGIGYGKISTMRAYPVKPFYLRPKIATAPVKPVPAETIVRKGDSLFSIAEAWGVTLTAVEKANPKAGHPAGNFNVVWAGDAIRHP